MGLLLSNALMRIFNMLNIDKNDHCHAGTLTLWGIKKKNHDMKYLPISL